MIAVRDALRAALLALVAVGPAMAVMAAPVVEVVPTSPRYMEPVYMHVLSDTGARHGYSASVSIDGSTIVVQFVAQPDSPACDYDVALGSFATGSYSVQVLGDVPGRHLTFVVASATDAAPMPDSYFVQAEASANVR